MNPEESEAQHPRQNGSNQSERLGDVRNLVGLLLAGFTGAVNLIGLRNAELTTILRNQGILVGLASVLLLGALICSIASIFAEGHRLHLLISGSVTSFLLAITALAIYAVRIPKTANWARGWILGCAVFLAALAVVGIVAWVIRRPGTPQVSLQFTLLIAAAILFSSAVTTVVRIEARNQAVTSLPQLEASTSLKGGIGEVSARASATKLRDNEYVLLVVQGLPTETLQEKIDKLEDSDHPCEGTDLCRVLADVDVYPDSFGNITRDFKFPFLLDNYTHLSVGAYICEAKLVKSQCQIGEKYSTVDLAVEASSE
ncbi:hypothetical protein [Streptomyces sp. SP17KL33]|uniref:hypothetical protein n=1 Tax=Streptomyces sp. SP17KL33 TaxID=3002534 RepID=UPI002E78D15B|nr:hypothetical protein [Streptomyces sp. SP17KL33]MEE1832181.1 hypothetical protein [Streptomyces sp. SP17KL33]